MPRRLRLADNETNSFAGMLWDTPTPMTVRLLDGPAHPLQPYLEWAKTKSLNRAEEHETVLRKWLEDHPNHSWAWVGT